MTEALLTGFEPPMGTNDRFPLTVITGEALPETETQRHTRELARMLVDRPDLLAAYEATQHAYIGGSTKDYERYGNFSAHVVVEDIEFNHECAAIIDPHPEHPELLVVLKNEDDHRKPENWIVVRHRILDGTHRLYRVKSPSVRKTEQGEWVELMLHAPDEIPTTLWVGGPTVRMQVSPEYRAEIVELGCPYSRSRDNNGRPELKDGRYFSVDVYKLSEAIEAIEAEGPQREALHLVTRELGDHAIGVATLLH